MYLSRTKLVLKMFPFKELKDDFAQTLKEWNDAPPQVKIQLSLPSLVEPLKGLSKTTVIFFSPGKLLSTNDVAQWSRPCLKALLWKDYTLHP